MTSKTFKSASGRRSIEVSEGDVAGSVALTIQDARGFYHTIPDLPQAVVPALSHAILHVGYPTLNLPYEIDEAKNYLLRHMDTIQREAAEAKDLAELEAEALECWKAFNNATDLVSFDDIQWSDLLPESQAKWLAVARRAREIRNEKKEITGDAT